MDWRIGLATGLVLTMSILSPAYACVPLIGEPPLPGESADAYKVRNEALQREREATWFKQRQANALQRATSIFIARDTDWWPPIKPRFRNGRPLPPRVAPIPYPAPSWFKPIDWLRGTPSRKLFRIERTATDCGPMAVGDTAFHQPGTLFVFFARKSPLSEKMLIDAIAVDRINDPALMTFVAKYRGKSPSSSP